MTPTSPRQFIRIAALASVWSLAAIGISGGGAQNTQAQEITQEQGTVDVMEVILVDCKLDDAGLAKVLAEKLSAFLKAQNDEGVFGIKKGPVEAAAFPPAMLAHLRKEGRVDMNVSTRERFQRGPSFQCVREVS